MFQIPGGWPPGSGNGKFGFSTVASVFTCFSVMVCVSIAYEYLDPPERAPVATTVPDDVQQVLPSGAWLLKDGSIRSAPQQQQK